MTDDANNKITAPFTPEQVANLNRYQHAGIFHPFTCGNANCRAVLEALPNGWCCPECYYRQDWAHGFMAAYDEAGAEE